MRLSLIAALGRNREIGKNGQLLWQIPEDLKRFKALTQGHPVIMGRKTWESLPGRFRPLPGRTNIVVTRQRHYIAPGAAIVHTLAEANVEAARAEGSEEIFVIGGGELYRESLSHAHRLYLTLIDETKDADTYFPHYEELFSVTTEDRRAGEPPYRFVVLDHK